MAKRKRSGGGALESMSVEQLRAELERRQSRLGDLLNRRSEMQSKMMSELALLDEHIESLGGAPGVIARRRGPGRPRGMAAAGVRRGSGRKRPRNEMNLVEALVGVLGEPMSVTDAAEAVQKAGYKTNSNNFRTIVNQTLINSGKFKRVGRGLYVAK